MKLSQGDTVLVISGKDKGKKGVILKVFRDTNKVVVADVNLRTKHIKRTPQQAGRKVTFVAPLSASNVMILDPKTGKPTRIGYKVDQKTGKKVRIAKASGTVLTRSKVEMKKGAPSAKANAAPEKASFWKKGKGAGAADAGLKGSEGAAATPATQMHTRSAGRGS